MIFAVIVTTFYEFSERPAIERRPIDCTNVDDCIPGITYTDFRNSNVTVIFIDYGADGSAEKWRAIDNYLLSEPQEINVFDMPSTAYELNVQYEEIRREYLKIFPGNYPENMARLPRASAKAGCSGLFFL